MDLPRVPALWQSVSWQLAWHVKRRHVHPLGGPFRRFEACLVVILGSMIYPPPYLPPPCICIYFHISCVAVSIASIHRCSRYALDPFLIGGNAATEGFSYYVLLSRSSLNPAYHSTILAHLSSTHYDINIHIHTYTVTLTHAHSHIHFRYVSLRNLL